MVKNSTGIVMASLIMGSWLISTIYLMSSTLSFHQPLLYFFVLLQMHLYTGLFITAHDAMHGTVAPNNKKLNNFIGQLCTLFYAVFPFQKLYIKHHQHHQFVHSEKDPDYYEGNFFVWYFHFIKQYITWWQIVVMALIYNILKIWIAEQNLLLFWVVPSLLSTLQLFYFGTYLPHKGEHHNKHQSETQTKNHILAFLSCYFFGYHYEHHDSPGTPWWALWKEKEKNLERENG
ncbi:MAG: fatty acid desaturase [Sphingobacteriales bacterium]|nr:fatty acid desaturase [Sphingobacteriales bacterium]